MILVQRVGVAFDQIPRIIEHRAAGRARHQFAPPLLQRRGKRLRLRFVNLGGLKYGIGDLLAGQAEFARFGIRHRHCRRQPARVDEQHRAAPQPVRIVDRHVGMLLATEFGQFRPHDRSQLCRRKHALKTSQLRARAEPQIKRRPRQAQRFQVRHARVFEEA